MWGVRAFRAPPVEALGLQGSTLEFGAWGLSGLGFSFWGLGLRA